MIIVVTVSCNSSRFMGEPGLLFDLCWYILCSIQTSDKDNAFGNGRVWLGALFLKRNLRTLKSEDVPVIVRVSKYFSVKWEIFSLPSTLTWSEKARKSYNFSQTFIRIVLKRSRITWCQVISGTIVDFSTIWVRLYSM